MINNKQYIASQPGPNDVVCCKGTPAIYHVGNRRFQVLVDAHCSSYAKAANNKMLKTQIVNSIIQAIFAAGGCFLSRVGKENGDECWQKIKMNKTKEKVGHALRRAVAARKPIFHAPSQDFLQCTKEQSIFSMQKPESPNSNLYQYFEQNFVEQQVQQQVNMESSSHHFPSLYEPISIKKCSQEERETIDIESAMLVEDSLMEPLQMESSFDEEITSVFADSLFREE